MPTRHRRRRSRLCRLLSVAGAASVGGLIFFAGAQTMGPLCSRIRLGVDTWSLQLDRLFPPPELLLSPPPEFLLSLPRQTSEADISFARRLLPTRDNSPPQHQEDRDQSPPQHQQDAVLLPDREVLVVAAEPCVGNAMCVFQGGVSSPARALGRLPGPGRHAYICPMPDAAHPLQAPLLLSSSAAAAAAAAAPLAPPAGLLNWTDRLVFDSALLHGGDVLLFAKSVDQSVNRRQGVINKDIANVQYIYRGGADGMVASLPATTSAQQVIRCLPPPAPLNSSNMDLHVMLALNGEKPIPSLATLHHPHNSGLSEKKLICACTMVRDVAKVLPEWVIYHEAVGVERFILVYDNASEDDLADQVSRLKSTGIDILTVAWPWTKTQEAGLSHCAALHQPSCKWMAFIDVDEFIFSPKWKFFEKPSKSLLAEVVLSAGPDVGQIFFPCYDFGPSGQTRHPYEGVSQGYTCRLTKAQHHKSLVRLEAVEDSLVNFVHHFNLKSGFHKMWTMLARINHYKFQAWVEFKPKFKRRVSTFVVDWSDPVNMQSNDRAPGLGVEPVEPAGWAESFCEVKDTIMQELSEKWFGFRFRGRGPRTEFNSDGDIALPPSLP